MYASRPCNLSLVFVVVVVAVVVHVLVSSAQQLPLTLSCGSDGGKDAEGKVWVSDKPFITKDDTNTRKTAQTQDPSLPSEIPYITARIFKSPATYTFKIQPNRRYFLRFYFYPASYDPGLNIEDSYFSVTANRLVLMKNFSVSITTTALTQAYIIREYSLASDSHSLLVTFAPSDRSFAFVNGIQVVEMPVLLFGNAPVVGMSSEAELDVNSSNLQTMFRLNVGGQGVDPVKDVGGLGRTWYNDFAYLDGAAEGVTGEASRDLAALQIQFGEHIPESAAPLQVYQTQRSSGMSSHLSYYTNLTWRFWVDPGFLYLTRLHFCENQELVVNKRVFDIFINDEEAQEAADVIAWTEAPRVAIFKDYVIHMSDNQTSIRVQLCPTLETGAQYADSFLNGLEIFKIGDVDKGFASPNPDLSQLQQVDQAAVAAAELNEYQEAIENKKKFIGGAVGGAAICVVTAAFIFAWKRNKERAVRGGGGGGSGGEGGSTPQGWSWLPISGSCASRKSSHNGHISSLAQSLSRHFSLTEIKQATNNFDESRVIGVGGFGKVYKGVIDGETKVAIKRSNPSSQQGVHEFETEIELLSKLRHKHLVSLMGYCDEENEMCLVYDYIERGTLREHLYDKESKLNGLSWKQRLEICIGAARGLHYLHTGAKYTIIHRDVKTTNILLDKNWVAKVSDFGLSKAGPDELSEESHVSTMVKGSFGYLDPEYFKRQQLTEKSDVYSFGVVLFEVLSGRPALDPSLAKEKVSLAEWALQCQRKGTLEEDLVDPHLKGKISPECMKKFAETAEKCLAENGLQRPSMGDVLWNLEFALQLQQRQKKQHQDEVEKSSQTDPGLLHLGNLSLGSESDASEIVTDSTIFSQIINPTGR